MRTVRVFQYVEQLDAFLVTTISRAGSRLGLAEWNPWYELVDCSPLIMIMANTG